MQSESAQFLPRKQLDLFLQALTNKGFQIIAPTPHDGGIQYQPISKSDELAAGYEDNRQYGSAEIYTTNSQRCFSWTTPQQSIKPFTFAAEEPLWQSSHSGTNLTFQTETPNIQPTIVFGVKGCDLAALQIQDAHFYHKPNPDPHYKKRRDNLLLIGMNCFRSDTQCFCHHTNDGPSVAAPCDCLMSELDDGYIIHHANKPITTVLASLDLASASPQQLAQAELETNRAKSNQQNKLPEIKEEELIKQWDHPEWEKIAQTCLSCGNCTAVCPTCFCYREESIPSLNMIDSTQTRSWDSCFTTHHSYIHGVFVRPERTHRYRQWLTHKFGSWQSQFGRTGCTGCGRCSTYCPVGIDPTKILKAIL
jgi:sulfhydrogenase subunit beta (sulfur reductase)